MVPPYITIWKINSCLLNFLVYLYKHGKKYNLKIKYENMTNGLVLNITMIVVVANMSPKYYVNLQNWIALIDITLQR